MIKSANITFNFDTELGTVTNVKCAIDGMEKKTRTTKKKSEIVEELASESVITLEAAKLVFNNKAIADMGLTSENRIVIKWETTGDKKKKLSMPIPIIGTDVAFDEEGSGNKMTKTFTVAYKGNQNAILAEFGTEFGIEAYKEGIWKLISRNSIKTAKTLEEVIELAEKEEPDFIVDGDENIEIDENIFNFNTL